MIALLAAVENVFPPVPADTAVALGAFLAARSTRISVLGVYGVTLGANLLTATVVFLLASRYGKRFLDSRLGRRLLSSKAQAEVKRQYEKHHLWGLFVSRFLPGYRAVVPPVAAAMGIPWYKALPQVAAATALWYGVLVFIAYRVGHSWNAVKDIVGDIGIAMLVAAIAVTVALVVYLKRRRAKRHHG